MPATIALWVLAASAGLATAAATPGGEAAATGAAEALVTRPQDTLWALSRRWAEAADGAGRAQWMVAVRRRNPDAFVDGNLHRLRPGVALALPVAAEVAAEDPAAADRLVRVHRARIEQGVAGPAPMTVAWTPGPQPPHADAGHRAAAPAPNPSLTAVRPTPAVPPDRSPAAAAAGAAASPARVTAGDPAPERPGYWAVVALAAVAATGTLAALTARGRRRRSPVPTTRTAAPVDRGPLRRPEGWPALAGATSGPAPVATDGPLHDGLPSTPVPAAPDAGAPDLDRLRLAVGQAQAALGRTDEARRTLHALAHGEPTAWRDAARQALAALPTETGVAPA